ncbi:MAG: SpoIIE family protein phosphatase [Desulfobacteraceae bacterium]|nr:SpoIIE family protein phosphatase [Desulfobacteraceae bacterium]
MEIGPDKKFAVRWSIKWKLFTIMTILMASLVAILTFIQISSQKHMLKNELDKKITLMKENLTERGKILTVNLKNQVENNIASFNFSGAIEAIKESTENTREIKYAVLMDSSGVAILHTLKSEFSHSRITKRDMRLLRQREPSVAEYKEKGESVIEIASPIQVSTEPWGVLKVVFTLKYLEKELEESEKQIASKINKMIYKSVIASLEYMFACFLVLFIMSSRFLKPLIHLTHCARKLAKGDFSVSSDIRIHSKDEIGVLAASFIEMSCEIKNSYEKLEEYNRTLEQKVEERTKELNRSLEEVEEANEKIMESIRYAKMIQSSLLTDENEMKKLFPESFAIWLPRDVVGGDIIFSDYSENSIVGAVVDCTGHGVPGAFMTMIASSGLKRIIKDEECKKPAQVLKKLNTVVKTLLKQDNKNTASDDGLDAAVFLVKPEERKLIFAGAKLPLFYVCNGETKVIKGDKQSIGYKRSELSFDFTTHTIELNEGMNFYITTDGLLDQIGGKKSIAFGKRRFINLLKEHTGKPFEEQRQVLLQAFNEYKGDNEVQDDVTVLGFGF